MRISLDVNNVINIYNKNAKAVAKESPSRKSDTIEISKEGKEIAKFLEIAKNIEIETKDVERIKTLIKEGKYQINDEDLARSILNFMKESDK
ncbi:flagellar biosynthesis anti-sigma factor FlgM [Caloramator sp. CAR-1]|uniref:flagellar biosynthesis anti-sigma factor FlgM n=1 Tax=Caloramator sp. CAR-1 TaxID=3062777 RepID=UPI0026E3C0C0|nr:flagellar biosynthesis anti-sigma factor FlgM [Caloramator sp. CAR-1]MDO6355377.1 flagellar biosynthesis anti-sigma factor FlgM [Caloramator sp. CAR-1]